MDNECKNFLKNNGFGDVISELSDIGIKSLNELEGLSNEDIESKTSLKPLQAKKLYDMMQNPRHPKSPRASSSSSMTGFGSSVDNPVVTEVQLANVANHEDFEFVALSGAPPQLVTPKFTLGTVELGEYIYKNESI